MCYRGIRLLIWTGNHLYGRRTRRMRRMAWKARVKCIMHKLQVLSEWRRRRVECFCGSRESCKIGYITLLCTSDHPRRTFSNSDSIFSSLVTIYQFVVDKMLLDKGVL